MMEIGNILSYFITPWSTCFGDFRTRKRYNTVNKFKKRFYILLDFAHMKTWFNIGHIWFVLLQLNHCHFLDNFSHNNPGAVFTFPAFLEKWQMQKCPATSMNFIQQTVRIRQIWFSNLCTIFYKLCQPG